MKINFSYQKRRLVEDNNTLGIRRGPTTRDNTIPKVSHELTAQLHSVDTPHYRQLLLYDKYVWERNLSLCPSNHYQISINLYFIFRPYNQSPFDHSYIPSSPFSLTSLFNHIISYHIIAMAAWLLGRSRTLAHHRHLHQNLVFFLGIGSSLNHTSFSSYSSSSFQSFVPFVNRPSYASRGNNSSATLFSFSRFESTEAEAQLELQQYVTEDDDNQVIIYYANLEWNS